MEPRLQRRVQRYGWDLAAEAYDQLWQTQLAGVQTELLACAALKPGERVLDVACGTGQVAFAAAGTVGPSGQVVGVDLSGHMVEAAQQRAHALGLVNVDFARMDAEDLALPDAYFDAVLCTLGLMYMPDPARAMHEMRRVLRPGGRAAVAVWGERTNCGWAALFGIVDAEVASDVCPLFFGLGQGGALAHLCAGVGLHVVVERRISDTLDYANADNACDAAFAGGPVALAWSRFDANVRTRVRASYVNAIEPWRAAHGYRVPAEFVVVAAVAPPRGGAT
jgi:ubiquinone/menaquinone biosynthesis C-methylase UbiE